MLYEVITNAVHHPLGSGIQPPSGGAPFGPRRHRATRPTAAGDRDRTRQPRECQAEELDGPAVITSYSIHYTKLYDAQGDLDAGGVIDDVLVGEA